MALPSSGQITLNEMHVEASGSSGTQSNINSAPIRALITKSASVQMAFTEWYGASSAPVIPPTIAASGPTTMSMNCPYVSSPSPYSTDVGYANPNIVFNNINQPAAPTPVYDPQYPAIAPGPDTFFSSASCTPNVYTGFSNAQLAAVIAYPKTSFGGYSSPARLTIYFNGRYSNSNWNTMRHTATTTGNLTIPRASCTYNTWWQGSNVPVANQPNYPTTSGQTSYRYNAPAPQQQIYYSNPQTNYIHWT